MSDKPRVWISRPTFPGVIERLEPYFEVTAEPAEVAFSRSELAARLAEARERIDTAGSAVKRAAKPKAKAELAVPQDFAAALRDNAKAKVTFEAFPSSQRREYVDWVTEAKQDATRAKRLATSIEWLAEGKRRNWKYETR